MIKFQRLGIEIILTTIPALLIMVMTRIITLIILSYNIGNNKNTSYSNKNNRKRDIMELSGKLQVQLMMAVLVVKKTIEQNCESFT